MSWSPEHTERVLSTLNQDGSRRWMRPRLSTGRFYQARRVVAYALMAIFVLIPHFKLNAKPLILLDIRHREFTFFGFTFLPTDTLLLAIFMVGVVVSIFLVTALFGRIWCGWMCPQLVYMEFLYRPIEYLLEGKPAFTGEANRKSTPARNVIKYILYFIVSLVLAHTFISYFIGVDQLWEWMQGPPTTHLLTFGAVLITTGLMMFDFCYFREQTCILACPYGRLQSVMLDRDSMIISYDPKRGEPRGKLVKDSKPEGPERGDCIDCHLCVVTCPTGIDIRDGLQLECVGCAQCIDACDEVMDKIEKPRGLIRYSSQARIARESGRILRPRMVVYPAILLVIASAFFYTLSTKRSSEVKILRAMGLPFTMQKTGEIVSPIRLKITNRTREAKSYSVTPVDAETDEMRIVDQPIQVPAGESVITPLSLISVASDFTGGRRTAALEVSDGEGFTERVEHLLMGPQNRASEARAPGKITDDTVKGPNSYEGKTGG